MLYYRGKTKEKQGKFKKKAFFLKIVRNYFFKPNIFATFATVILNTIFLP